MEHRRLYQALNFGGVGKSKPGPECGETRPGNFEPRSETPPNCPVSRLLVGSPSRVGLNSSAAPLLSGRGRRKWVGSLATPADSHPREKLFGVATLFGAYDTQLSEQSVILVMRPGSEEQLV